MVNIFCFSLDYKFLDNKEQVINVFVFRVFPITPIIEFSKYLLISVERIITWGLCFEGHSIDVPWGGTGNL